MNKAHIKLLFYTALLLVFITCLTTACHKGNIRPVQNTQSLDSAAKDSLAVLDSLPSFNSPAGVAVDAQGNVYVADYGNNLIREITPAGVVSTLAGSGNGGYIDGTGVLSSFTQPAGIAIDPSGNLYIADSGDDLIREVTQAGVVTTIAGRDSTGFINGLADSAAFFDPLGLAVDANDNIYVADAGNDLIRLISAGNVTTFAGTINTGSSTQLSPFNNPTGIAIDATGNLFIANYLANNILKVTPAGAVTTYAGTGATGAANGPAASATFYYPNSIAVDAADNVYVADGVNNLIRKISAGGLVSTLAGSGQAGAADSTGTAASFNGPAGLAVDAAGNVYVADSNNNLIRKITPAGVVTTIAGSGLEGAKNGIASTRRNKRFHIKIAAKARYNIFDKPGRRSQ